MIAFVVRSAELTRINSPRWTISSTRFSASLLSKMVSALSIPLKKTEVST